MGYDDGLAVLRSLWVSSPVVLFVPDGVCVTGVVNPRPDCHPDPDYFTPSTDGDDSVMIWQTRLWDITDRPIT